MKYRSILTLSAAHAVTDINQGAVPALLPFLIGTYGLSYAAAAAIVFATNISSSLVQPLFGHFADRRPKPWLMPAGVLFAGVGLALSGVVPSYRLVLCVVALSGIGIAAFHPEAARLVNDLSGAKKATAMSFFAVGGQVGFAVAPVFTTLLVASFGLGGTLFLAVLPVCTAFAIAGLHRSLFTVGQTGRAASGLSPGEAGGVDAWKPFTLLTGAIFFRSFAFYGLNTFLPLYFIDVLHRSKMTGGAAITVFLGAGVCGTLLGGRLGDRYGYRPVALFAFCWASVLLPVFILMHQAWAAMLLLVPLGFAHFMSMSPLVVLGQKFLPTRVGLASGVTLGLSISMGGIAAPLVGRLADIYGMPAAFMAMTLFPVIAGCFVLATPGSHPAARLSFSR
jgi:FSR family fosmidomycin resistance protein-like MFS transporter